MPKLLTRAEFRLRKDRINAWVLALYLGGFLLGCLVPIGGMIARSVMGSAFPESAVAPTLGAMIVLWIAGPLGALLAPPVVVRTLGLRCPYCGGSLADRRGWARVVSPGLCMDCGRPVFADPTSLGPVFESRDAFVAQHPSFGMQRQRYDRRTPVLWVGLMLAGLGLGATVVLHAPLVFAIAFAVLGLIAAASFHRHSEESRPSEVTGVPCPSCGGELVNVGIRRQRDLIDRVLATGACPYCGAPLFPVRQPSAA
jgi:hypothetical protein